jgi:D-glycero-D-manno-heptose 1,7-bisphosphate phosphatase
MTTRVRQAELIVLPSELIPNNLVLLDRDGVINRQIENGYVTSWEQWEFLPGALVALRLLAKNGFRTLVISNQACVGKGLLRYGDLEEITRRFVKEVKNNGGRIDGVYYCTHRKEDCCECRKPKPGLLLRAQSEHGFSFRGSFLVGDSETDFHAAHAVGCPPLLISNGAPHRLRELSQLPCLVFPSLYASVLYILGGGKA